MKTCRWCDATSTGLCYAHLSQRLRRDEAIRRWTLDVFLVLMAGVVYLLVRR